MESFMKAAISEHSLPGWGRILPSRDNRERTFQKKATSQVKLEEYRAEVLDSSVHRVRQELVNYENSLIPTPKF